MDVHPGHGDYMREPAKPLTANSPGLGAPKGLSTRLQYARNPDLNYPWTRSFVWISVEG